MVFDLTFKKKSEPDPTYQKAGSGSDLEKKTGSGSNLRKTARNRILPHFDQIEIVFIAMVLIRDGNSEHIAHA